MRFRRLFPFLTVATMALAGPSLVFAGPPLVTDDPETPGRHGWEVNFSHNIEKVRDEFLMAVPFFDFNYGFLENDQFKIEFPVLSVDPTDDRNVWGIGDLLIGYKYRYLEEEKRGFMASIYPQLLVPVASEQRGLGDDRIELEIPFQFGKHFLDEKLFVYAEVGYIVVFEETDFNFWFYGVAAEWQATEKLKIMGEMAGHVFPRSAGPAGVDLLAQFHGDDPDDVFFNLGVKYEFNDNVAFIGSAGRSFLSRDQGTPELLTFVGLQITWGREKKEEDKKNGNGENGNGKREPR